MYSKLGTMSSCRALHIELKTKKNPSKLLFQLVVSLPSDFKYLFLLCNEFISAVFRRLSKTNGYSLKWEFSYLIYLSAVFCPLLSKCYNICLPVLENKVRIRTHTHFLATLVINNLPAKTYTEIHHSLFVCLFTTIFLQAMCLFLRQPAWEKEHAHRGPRGRGRERES